MRDRAGRDQRHVTRRVIQQAFEPYDCSGMFYFRYSFELIPGYGARTPSFMKADSNGVTISGSGKIRRSSLSA
jgi:hypothetical protein